MPAPPTRRRSLCQHCGLPVLGRASSTPQPDEIVFCCYGCRLAHEIVRGDGHAGSGLPGGILTRLMLGVFLSMGVMVFSLALYADVWFAAAPGHDHPLGSLAPLFRWIAFAFATPAVALLGWPLLLGGSARDPGSRAVNALIVVGVAAAYTLSVVNLARGEGDVYFETAVMILVLVTLGRFLDAKARYQASSSMRDLLSIDPKEATRLAPSESSTAELVRIDAGEVKRGDLLRVVAGDRAPADGVVTRGRADVDESILTGESDAREVHPGEPVHAGSLVVEGVLDFEVRAEPGERLLDRMAETVACARERRMPLERLAERVASGFLAAAITVASLTFLYWLTVIDTETAILRSLAVLLIACPCALGIATPLASWIAVGRAAREGILVRGGEVFERLARPLRVFFDKTGTLTTRDLRVTAVHSVPPRSESEVLVVAASLATSSRHPVSEAISRSALSQNLPVRSAAEVESGLGLGLAARVDQERVVVGNAGWLESESVDVSTLDRIPSVSEGDGRVLVAVDGVAVGAIDHREELRPEARRVAQEFAARGCEPRVLTGDRAPRGAAISSRVGVPVDAQLLPTDKVGIVDHAKSPKHTVVMVGDGLNDAPVLAAADVAVALGGGADLTRDTSDVVLLEDGDHVLEKVLRLVDLSRETLQRIRFNLFWAFAYNGVGMLLACLGYVHPIGAALLMIASSLFVILGSTVGATSRREGDPEPGAEP